MTFVFLLVYVTIKSVRLTVLILTSRGPPSVTFRTDLFVRDFALRYYSRTFRVLTLFFGIGSDRLPNRPDRL